MGLEKRQNKSLAVEDSASERRVEVIEEAVFQGACDISLVKQELSEMEEIMEGDIILKVNPGGDWQIISGNNRSKYCMEHLDMYLHQDDNLPKVGDTFKSHQDFVQYISSNAKRWCFYYKCTESQNTDTENEAYTYHCVYLKNREYKRKTLKKRNNFKTDCPCKIRLKRKPNENLKVVFVCNHHDHDLSEENFHKLQTNKKLSPYLKEVIMDLLSLEVEISKIRKYVEMESGVKMSRAFFYDMERKMKLNNEERHITDKRLKELSDKMSVLDEIFSCDDDDDNSEDVGNNSKNKRSKLTRGSSAKRIKFQEEVDEPNQSEEYLEENLEESQDGMTTLDWEESAIATEESPENAEHDEENFPDNCENTYTDDYNSADYTVSETVQETTSKETEQTTEQPEEQYEYQTVVLQDEFGNVINCENDEQIVFLQHDADNPPPDGQTIGYFDGEKIIYVDPNEANNETGHDVAVQTNTQKPGHSESKIIDEGNEIPDLPAPNGTQEIVKGDTYTKHEYIHRYNIDHYMTLANFPKYIDTLAKKTRNDVLSMLTRVYNEKAMFKMTTTQKGNEGNTKIWYLTDVRRKGKYKMSEEEKMKRDKIGQYITDILILKEKVKTLTNDNSELVSRNKYLEDVALRLAKLRNN